MIVRSWTGHATAAGAEAYVAYVRRRLLPELQRLEGHRGCLILGQDAGDEVAVKVLTFWDSVAAIGRFAGGDVTAAVVEPAARALLTRFDARAEHLRLLVDARG